MKINSLTAHFRKVYLYQPSWTYVNNVLNENHFMFVLNSNTFKANVLRLNFYVKIVNI